MIALIFKNIKSILPGYYNEKKVAEFANIPDGEEVTVLAYRVDKKNKSAVVGVQEVTLGEEGQVDLTMNEMSLDDFKLLLTKFN